VRRNLLALVVMGFASLTVGIVAAFVSPRLDHLSFSIPTYGRIAYPESQNPVGSSENYVDERGYVPVIVGAGLLSVAFFTRLVERRVRISQT